MSFEKLECPVENCGFVSKSLFSDPEKGLKGHIRQLDGNGHGPCGEIPERLAEKLRKGGQV